MQQIPSQSVASKITIGKFVLPYAVDTICPHCGRKVAFTCNWLTDRKLRQELMHAEAKCPACSKITTFIQVNLFDNGFQCVDGEMFIYPHASRRDTLEDIDNSMPEALERAYRAAVNIFNVGEWNGAVTLCRRVLEGITKTSLPIDKQKLTLFKQIEELSNHVDFSKPMKELAHSLRSGGNLGAHFDLDKEADQDTATLMFDLLDSLIEYIYVLPKKITALDVKIQALNSKPD